MTTVHDRPTRRWTARAATVTSNTDYERAAIRVAGDLDDLAALHLHSVIDSQVREGRRFLRIDLSGVTAIGESAVDLLVDTHRRVLAQRGTLVLIGAAQAITRTLRSADLGAELFLLDPFASDPLDY